MAHDEIYILSFTMPLIEVIRKGSSINSEKIRSYMDDVSYMYSDIFIAHQSLPHIADS